MVEVQATGWVGFGFATQAPNGMVGYDVAVGGVQGGSIGYLKVGCCKIMILLYNVHYFIIDSKDKSAISFLFSSLG